MQTHSIATLNGFQELRVHQSEHCPSWRTWPRDGWAEFRVTFSPNWVAMSLTESPKNGPRRETMLTLDPPAARALYDELRTIFEPAP